MEKPTFKKLTNHIKNKKLKETFIIYGRFKAKFLHNGSLLLEDKHRSSIKFELVSDDVKEMEKFVV